MRSQRPMRALATTSLCASLFLAACGDDVAASLSQPRLADPAPIGEGYDVVDPTPDTVTPPSDTVTPPNDTVTPPNDTVTPPNDVVVVPDTTPPADTVTPPNDVGPTDTIATDTTPIACTGAADCPDNPPCGRGSCVGGFCNFTAIANGGPCDDGDLCTTGDRCSAGRCVGTGRLDCRDGDACTDGFCISGEGCVQEPTNCDDANVCTNDSCDPNVGCVNTPIVCPPVPGQCVVASCHPVNGCGSSPAPDGMSCIDGDFCTTDDHCVGGTCTGTSRCDDNDPCTLDSCLPAGACSNIAIPGCAVNDPCAGKLGGEACDDGDAGTTADMCIGGTCKGYTLRRIPGSTVNGYQGLIVQEVDYGPDGWSAILWSARLNDAGEAVFAWSLGRITNPGQPYVHVGSTSTTSNYVELSDGMVIRGFEDVLMYGNNGWSSNNGFNRAVGDEQVDFISALYSRTDVSFSGNVGTRRAWIGGMDSGDGVVLACRTTQQGVRCDPQDLDSPEAGPYPVAFAGVPICGSNGACSGQWMGTATYLQDDQANDYIRFNDTYVNPTGTDELWDEGWFAEESSIDQIWSMAAWGTSAAPRMLAVGGAGYMNFMGGTNDWTGPILVRVGQEDRTFTGATVSVDAVIVSATRHTADQVVYELWTVPTNRDASVGANWSVLELGRGPIADAAGLYDVGGRQNGEVMAVGGTRRVNVTNDAAWLDGLVYWRQAP